MAEQDMPNVGDDVLVRGRVLEVNRDDPDRLPIRMEFMRRDDLLSTAWITPECLSPPCTLPAKARELLGDAATSLRGRGEHVRSDKILGYLAAATACECAGLRKKMSDTDIALGRASIERDSLRAENERLEKVLAQVEDARDGDHESAKNQMEFHIRIQRQLREERDSLREQLAEALAWMREHQHWWRHMSQSAEHDFKTIDDLHNRRDAILARHEPDAQAERRYCQQCVGSGTHLVDRGGGTWYCPACTWEGRIAEAQAEPTRECEWCGSDFAAEYSWQKFCDAKCEDQANKQKPAEPTPAVCSRCNKPPHTPCSDPECGLYEQPTPEPQLYGWYTVDWSKTFDSPEDPPRGPGQLISNEVAHVIHWPGWGGGHSEDDNEWCVDPRALTPCAAPPVEVENEPVTRESGRYRWRGWLLSKEECQAFADNASGRAAHLLAAIAELERRASVEGE